MLEVPEQYSGHPAEGDGAEGGRGVAPAWKDLTQAPRLVLGICRGAVGYKVGEEGRVLNIRAVDLDLTLKATDSYFEQESEIKRYSQEEFSSCPYRLGWRVGNVQEV